MVEADAVVVGAGVAGATVAAALADAGARVVVFEKEEFPRHKLCGEFLSYEVRDALAAIGVEDALRDQGARELREVGMSAGRGTSFEADLPEAALGISRYRLDRTLAERAERGGATTRFRESVRDISGSIDRGFEIRTTSTRARCRLVIGAYGRQSPLDRKLERSAVRTRNKMVGFKAHFRGLEMGHRIELHAFPGGYCGMSPIESGLINVCWLTTAAALQRAGGRPADMVRNSLASNDLLREKMEKLERVSPGYLSVAGLSFSRRSTWSRDVMMVGDTAGMISPLCGDGMAMAVASASLAAPRAMAFLSGELSAQDLRVQYHRSWTRQFKTRMLYGNWLNRIATDSRMPTLLLKILRRTPSLGEWLIRRTRS